MIERDDELAPDVLELLAQALPEVAPRIDLRARLLAAMAGRERFTPFLDRLMRMFDLDEPATRAEVDAIDDPQAEWEEMVDGCRFRDFDGGPAIGDAHGGLVRVAPGAVFPNHRHVGDERMLVLQGEVVDAEGHRYRAGDEITMADGTVHELRVVGERELIYAAVIVAIDFVLPDEG